MPDRRRCHLLWCLAVAGLVVWSSGAPAQRAGPALPVPATEPVVAADQTSTDAADEDGLSEDDSDFDLPPEPPEPYGEITARPLFFESRRPPLPEEEAAQLEPESVPTGPATPPVNIKFQGVMIFDGTARAMLREARGERAEFVTAGEQFGGWDVATVDPREVTLQRGSETNTLKLERKGVAQPRRSSAQAAALARAKAAAARRKRATGQSSDDEASPDPEEKQLIDALREAETSSDQRQRFIEALKRRRAAAANPEEAAAN